MEGPEYRAFRTRLHAGCPLGHLAGSLVGKGNREDRFGLDVPLGDEPGNLCRDNPRLAGTGAGEYEKRRTLMGYRSVLFWIQDLEGRLGVHRTTASISTPLTAMTTAFTTEPGAIGAPSRSF